MPRISVVRASPLCRLIITFFMTYFFRLPMWGLEILRLRFLYHVEFVSLASYTGVESVHRHWPGPSPTPLILGNWDLLQGSVQQSYDVPRFMHMYQ